MGRTPETKGFFIVPMALTFTNIQHGFRKKEKLSCLEYVLCDMIFYLSNNDGSPVPGWCYMAKEKIAEELDITKQGVLKMIDRLIESGFLYKNEQTRHLKTSAKWQQVYYNENGPGVNLVYQGGQQSLLQGGQQSLPNNNTSYNNSNNGVATPQTKEEIIKKKKIKFCKNLIDFVIANPDKYPKALYMEFTRYWFEPSASNKLRFESQQFFDLTRRLNTWFKNTKQETLQQYWEQEPKTDTLNKTLKTLL